MIGPEQIFSVSEGDASYRLFLPDSDEDYIQKRIRETGTPYEAHMLRDMARRLSSADTVFDIGANIGNHTIYLARMVGCRVIAFEPNAHLARAIRESAGLNGLSERVEVHDVGVGSQPGIAHFHHEIRENLGGQALELGTGDIRIITLDGLDRAGPVRAIKIDVEGFELSVLQGAQALISRDRPIIYAECADEQQFGPVFDWLAEAEYVLCEQFNATPTHLFLPAEQVTLPAYSRDVVRQKTIDLYRSQDDLRTTTQKLHAASEKARNAGLYINDLKDRAARLTAALNDEKTRSAQLKSKVTLLERENGGLRSGYQTVRTKLIAVQKSRTFRTGTAVREALSSPRGFLALPVRLWRVMRSPAFELSTQPQISRAGSAVQTSKVVATPSARMAAPKTWIEITELAANRDFVVLAGAYPSSAGEYGGEFIRSRAESYARNGLAGMVVELNRRNTALTLDHSGPLPVVRMPPSLLDDVVAVLAPGRAAVLAHSPTPDMQAALIRGIQGQRLVFWFHGFELRDYRRLFYNFDTAEREQRRASLDLINRQRWDAARESFSVPDLTTVFVSNFLLDIATRDVGRAPANVQVIPNFIDGDYYRPVDRDDGAARRILMIRPFKARNYGYDIAVEAIRILSSRKGFAELSFTLRGFGENFAKVTASLTGLPNVTLEDRYSTPDEMRELHAAHGIMLCPTRHDTQGVALGEAMASGMACITHDVAAIPEFADENCAILVRPDDPNAYAEAIWSLAHDPDLVRRLGAAAADRVRAQCSVIQTVQREEALIRTVLDKEAQDEQ